MSEQWVSQGRKMCSVCKVWFGDNRASLEHHESGQKHKAALAEKLRELGRNSTIKAKMESKMNSTLAYMERAAMESMKERGEGLAHGPSLPAMGVPTASRIFDPRQFKDVSSMAQAMDQRKKEGKRPAQSAPRPTYKVPRKEEMKVEPPAEEIGQKLWVEALAEDGRSYYYHMFSGDKAAASRVKTEAAELTANPSSQDIERHDGMSSDMASLLSSYEGIPIPDEAPPDVPLPAPVVQEEPAPVENIPEPAPYIPEPALYIPEPKYQPAEDIYHGYVDNTPEPFSTLPPPVPKLEAREAEEEEVEEPPKPSFGPYGGWTKVKPSTSAPMDSPLTAKYRAQEAAEKKEAEERAKLEERFQPKILFEEKVSATSTKKVKGPIEFKKKTGPKNIRKREE